MRNLDELLQEIPLDELLEGKEKNKESKNRSPRRLIKHTEKEKTSVRLKSKGYTAAAAAVLALAVGAGAIAVVGSRGTLPEPGPAASGLEADPISLPDRIEARSSEREHPDQLLTFDTIAAGTQAKLIFQAMESYLNEYEGFIPLSIRTKGELYFDLGNPAADVKNLTYELEEQCGFELDEGYAFIGFGSDSELLFAEWTDKLDGTVQLYKKSGYNGTTNTLGDYPEEYKYAAASDYSNYGKVDITYNMSNGTTSQAHLDRIYAGDLINAYIHLIQREPQRSAPTDWLEEGDSVRIHFFFFGEEVNVNIEGRPVGEYKVNHSGTNSSFYTTDDTLLEEALNFVE